MICWCACENNCRVAEKLAAGATRFAGPWEGSGLRKRDRRSWPANQQRDVVDNRIAHHGQRTRIPARPMCHGLSAKPLAHTPRGCQTYARTNTLVHVRFARSTTRWAATLAASTIAPGRPKTRRAMLTAATIAHELASPRKALLHKQGLH